MRNKFTWLSAAFLVAAGILTCQPVQAQAPAWQSAIALGQTATGFSGVTATATDASGNVYIAGSFTKTIQVGATILTSGAGEGIFVAKWSSSTSSFVWAQRAGGAVSDYVTAIAVNGSNIYIAGGIKSLAADFGNFTLTNANQNSNAFSDDLFVAKLTDAGTLASFTWAQRAGGSELESVNDLVVVGSNVYVAGQFTSPSIQLGATTLTRTGNYNGFVAKLVDTGTSPSFVWAQTGGGTGGSGFSKLVVNGTSVVAAGEYEGTVSFGTLATTLTSVGESDVVVAKLTDLGTSAQYAWARDAGGSGHEYVRGMAVSGNNIYLAGNFSSPLLAFGQTTLQSIGGTTGDDVFVAKLTDAGATAGFIWAQRAGGNEDEGVTALLVRGTSVYIAGYFNSATAGFGGLTLTNSAARTSDIFLSRLQDAGNTSSFSWVQRAGSGKDDYCLSLASSGTTIYAGGAVGLPATFSSQSLAGASTGSVGFLASISDATGLAATSPSTLAEFTLASNPAHGATTVLLSAGVGNTEATLTLLDAVGRVVHTQVSRSGPSATLDLAGIVPGLYILRVQAGETLAVRRLVVE